jgi:ATP-dependent RNA helicase RhlE
MQEQNLSFYHLGIAPKMLQVLEKLEFVKPTPVQHQAIPLAIEGKDVVAVAQTGTGKTLAFGIPMVQALANTDGQGLILAPTRDLAIQVNDVIKTILTPFKLKSVVLVGGMPMGAQISQLRKGPQIIIATPGRLIDHIERRTISLKKVAFFVLDEADRMLDMGFTPQVNRILEDIPSERQTLLFSATMPADIVKLATKYMQMPINVEIAPSGKAAKNVTQELFIIKEVNKGTLMTALLEKYRGSVLLFIRTKTKTRKIARELNQAGHKSVEIHSDRSMHQRKQAIEGFRSGRYRILVATDVAARGIDIKNIELVINYDLPDDVENYVHRIGRTGRGDQKGHAITFASPNQGRDVRNIESMIKKQIPIGVHEGFAEETFDRGRGGASKSGKGRSAYGGGGKSFGKKSYGSKSSGNSGYGAKSSGPRSYGAKPAGKRTFNSQPVSERPYGTKSYGSKPAGERSYGSKPAGKKSYGSKPSGERSGGSKFFGEKSYGSKPAGERSYGSKPSGNKSYGSKPAGERSYGSKPSGNKSYGSKPAGERSYGSKPSGNKSYGSKPDGNKTFGHRPYETKAPAKKSYASKPSSPKSYGSGLATTKTAGGRPPRKKSFKGKAAARA